MLPGVPSPHDPHVRTMRRMFLAVVTGSFLFLIPWIAYLSTSLPTHHEVDQWRAAWVGFDAVLIVALGITALCAWRRLQIFIPWAVVTATLLGCDAWFDIVLDWNSDDLTGSILTAVFAELPLAALLLYVARRMIRLTLIVAWYHAGRSGPVPPLSRLSLRALTTPMEREEAQRREPGREAEPDGAPGRRPSPPAPAADDDSRPAPDAATPDAQTPDTETEHPDDEHRRPPRDPD